MNLPPHVCRRMRIVSLVGVAVLLLVMVMGTAHVEPTGSERAVNAGAYALGAIAVVSLLMWRRRPLLMVCLVAAALFTYLAVAYPPGPALLPGPLSVAILGAVGTRRRAWLGAGIMASAVIAGVLIGELRPGMAVAAAGWSLAGVLAGQLAGARRDRKWGERERRRLSERHAVAEERLRIAQDLHDSVAHAMATINVQAGAASHLLERKGDGVDRQQIGTALEAIRSASSEVLDELGAILGVLRRDPVAGHAPADRAPHVTLDQVDELVSRAAADGLDVTLVRDEPPTQIGPAISAAAYRVVQEALSNVRQHAGVTARVRIELVGGQPGELSLTVVDDGGGRPAVVPARASQGFGLLGMRERVESTGGTLDVGPTPGGGFGVAARWVRR